MIDQYRSVKDDVIWGVLIVALSFFVSLIFSYGPNVYVVGAILIGFFIRRVDVMTVVGLGYLWLMRPSIFFWWEMLVGVLLILLSFMVMRLVLFERNGFSLAVLVVIGQIIGWGVLAGAGAVVSVVFVSETLWSILLAEVLFGIVLWAKKTFS